MTRVTSSDGTGIAFWTSGKGPPLIVVHGTPADHTRWQPLLPYLETHVTVHAMDRRGRGASGDGPEYDLAREHEDVAAIVDAVATATGSKVDVYGHSHGGFCAYGAVSRTSNIRKLVLYEGWPLPDPSVLAFPVELEARLDALLATDDRAGVVAAVFRHYGLTEDDLIAFRAAPSWPGRVAAAHTIVREIRAEASAKFDAGLAATISIPVLLVVGEESADPVRLHVETVASALPDAQISVLPGQGHVADVLAPEVFAATLLAFLHPSN